MLSSTHAAPRVASAWPSEAAAASRPTSVGIGGRVPPRGRDVIRRLLRSADFERVLRTRSQVNTPHFAVHHIADHPRMTTGPHAELQAPIDSTALAAKLSTAAEVNREVAVDDLVAPVDVWLGAVVPKRHARRSVTRTLIKRQIRAVVSRHSDALARGLWVIRLRAPFDRAAYSSAASDALKAAARIELEQLLARASRRAVGS